MKDELDKTQEALSELQASASDSGPVHSIRAALKRIRAEIVDLDLRVAVAAHSVMQKQLKDSSAHLVDNSFDDDSDSSYVPDSDSD